MCTLTYSSCWWKKRIGKYLPTLFHDWRAKFCLQWFATRTAATQLKLEEEDTQISFSSICTRSLLHFDPPSPFNIRCSPLLPLPFANTSSFIVIISFVIPNGWRTDWTHIGRTSAPLIPSLLELLSLSLSLSAPYCLSRSVHSLWSMITWCILDWIVWMFCSSNVILAVGFERLSSDCADADALSTKNNNRVVIYPSIYIWLILVSARNEQQWRKQTDSLIDDYQNNSAEDKQ